MREARKRFAADREDATMTVLKDDGVYRHLRLHFPKASWGWCEIVTWPEMLILRGPYWSFSRVEDMFDFTSVLWPPCTRRRRALRPGGRTARPDRGSPESSAGLGKLQL
ncbi:hypothetical protein NI25_32885 [Streptomyces sp. CCM_MD2014]|nr:hypothetical protein NI25_32885 [Streptomyces sp. CCM_MD2014]